MRLTFPTNPLANGGSATERVTLASVQGQTIRYEVRRLKSGEWRAAIDIGAPRFKWRPFTSRDFGSQRAAMAFCVADCARRQMMKRVA